MWCVTQHAHPTTGLHHRAASTRPPRPGLQVLHAPRGPVCCPHCGHLGSLRPRPRSVQPSGPWQHGNGPRGFIPCAHGWEPHHQQVCRGQLYLPGLLVVRPVTEALISHFSMEVTGTQTSVRVNKGFLAFASALPGLLSRTGIPVALTAFHTGPPADKSASPAWRQTPGSNMVPPPSGSANRGEWGCCVHSHDIGSPVNAGWLPVPPDVAKPVLTTRPHPSPRPSWPCWTPLTPVQPSAGIVRPPSVPGVRFQPPHTTGRCHACQSSCFFFFLSSIWVFISFYLFYFF